MRFSEPYFVSCSNKNTSLLAGVFVVPELFYECDAF